MNRHYSKREVEVALLAIRECPVPLDRATYTPDFDRVHDRIVSVLGREMPKFKTYQLTLYIRKSCRLKHLRHGRGFCGGGKS